MLSSRAVNWPFLIQDHEYNLWLNRTLGYRYCEDTRPGQQLEVAQRQHTRVTRELQWGLTFSQ
eukprot:1160263-Pelagomonas_calceolata.AAC.1